MTPRDRAIALFSANPAPGEEQLRHRRVLACYCPIPPDDSVHFSMAEQAILCVLVTQCRAESPYPLDLAYIARSAGVSERTVSSLLTNAKEMGFLSLKRRQSLPSLITLDKDSWKTTPYPDR